MARARDARSSQGRTGTLAPTAHRLAQARRSGEVAQSADLRAGVALAATGVALALLGPQILGQLIAFTEAALGQAARGEALAAAAARAFDSGARVLSVPVAVAFAVTWAVGLIQTGGLWLGPPRADLGRLSPGAALRRLRGGSALVDTLAGLVKVALVGLVAAATVGTPRSWAPALVGLAGVPARRALAAFGVTAQRLGGRVLLAVLFIGAADYAWARRRHQRALRMTRRDIERERRELEGDPHARAERRRRQGERKIGEAINEAINAISGADLLITGTSDSDGNMDPVVALVHDRSGARAPLVVAIGRRAVAPAWVAAARTAGVAVVADAALAAALGDLDVGAEIPESTYEPVARLLRDALGLGLPLALGPGLAPGRGHDPTTPMSHGASRRDA
jgi:flagellar biosynthesis protein FlhB